MAKSNVVKLKTSKGQEKEKSYREKLAERYKIDLSNISAEDAEYILVNNAKLISLYNQRDGQKLYSAIERKVNGDGQELSETEVAEENKALKGAGRILTYAMEVAKIVNKKHAEEIKALAAVMRECSFKL